MQKADTSLKTNVTDKLRPLPPLSSGTNSKPITYDTVETMRKYAEKEEK